MDTILRFGAGIQLYTFTPDDQLSYRDNFRDVVPRTSRLPGLSGGFDEYGVSPAPTEIGNVSMQFWVLADTPADMYQAKLDIGRMRTFGKRRLYKQPVDGNADEVYCEARINSITWNETTQDRPDKYLRFTVDWQVDNPFWFAQGTEAPQYGDGSTFGSGVTYGGSPITQSLLGV
ncbi:MAG: hypothetical protein AAFN11_04840, partial [Chloroflexota bacterium]